EFGFDLSFDKAKHFLEENDGAGNTFKATAKPVLIGTAVVGATTMIFSIIVVLTAGLTQNLEKLSLLHPPFLLGLITGGAVIYWFTGAATQAVSTGAYRAVEFIKANIRLEGATKASVTDSKKVVEICTQYAQKGMFNIFLTVFFSTLAFAFLEPYFFIGYLISIALRPLPGGVHGQCGRRLGQRQEDRRDRAERKGQRAARGHRRRRHRRRPLQGHLLGGHEPGDQVHHALRPPGRGAGRESDRDQRPRPQPRAEPGVLRALDGVRVALVLRHADQGRRAGRHARPRGRRRAGQVARRWSFSTTWRGASTRSTRSSSGAGTRSSSPSSSPRPASSSASSCRATRCWSPPASWPRPAR